MCQCLFYRDVSIVLHLMLSIYIMRVYLQISFACDFFPSGCPSLFLFTRIFSFFFLSYSFFSSFPLSSVSVFFCLISFLPFLLHSSSLSYSFSSGSCTVSVYRVRIRVFFFIYFRFSPFVYLFSPFFFFSLSISAFFLLFFIYFRFFSSCLSIFVVFLLFFIHFRIHLYVYVFISTSTWKYVIGLHIDILSHLHTNNSILYVLGHTQNLMNV